MTKSQIEKTLSKRLEVTLEDVVVRATFPEPDRSDEQVKLLMAQEPGSPIRGELKKSSNEQIEAFCLLNYATHHFDEGTKMHRFTPIVL